MRGVVIAALCAGMLGCTSKGELAVQRAAAPISELPPTGAVRVVSWNIGSATHSYPNGAFSARHILEVMIYDILRWRRDDTRQWNVFALQEVDRRTNRSGNIDQPQRIDDRLGTYDGSNPYTGYENAFVRTRSVERGEFGLATIANHRLDEVRVLHYTCGGDDSEPRVAQITRLANAPTPTWIANTHLALDTKQSICQVRQLLAWVANYVPADDVVVVTGDFNIRRDGSPDSDPSKDHATAWADMRDEMRAAGFGNAGDDEHTFPAHAPNRTVDYAFVRDPRNLLMRSDLDVVDSGAAASGIHPTDHRALVLDLRWCDAACRSLPGIL